LRATRVDRESRGPGFGPQGEQHDAGLGATAAVTMDTAAAPTPPSAEAEAFYAGGLRELTKSGFAYLVGGTYAVSAYTGITRPTKDLDIFCRPGDGLRILEHFKHLGYRIEIEDERWLAKVFEGEHFFDVIFAAGHGNLAVTDVWFEHAPRCEVLGTSVQLVAPTELIWSKAFVQARHRYDGADIIHLILRQRERIDWERLLAHMDLDWEVLLAHLLNFRWAYPSERNHVPRSLIAALVDRLQRQLDLPAPRVRVCRGRTFSQADYDIAVKEWGFHDADVGE
jgi:Uncharacterised nucleotidyltransferase